MIKKIVSSLFGLFWIIVIPLAIIINVTEWFGSLSKAEVITYFLIFIASIFCIKKYPVFVKNVLIVAALIFLAISVIYTLGVIFDGNVPPL